MKIDYRSIFIAPPNKLLVQLDLSQAESWVVAYLANEPTMKYALKYSDIHCFSAGGIFVLNNCSHDWDKNNKTCKKCNSIINKNQRYLGKRRNHSCSYGANAYKSMEVINSDSDKPPYISITLKESEEHHKRWHELFYIKGWWAEVKRKDRTITTTYGRARTFYGAWIESPIDKPSELEKEKIAFEPQSVVADHFNGKIHPIVRRKGGLIEIYKKFIKPYNCGNIRCTHNKCHKIINQSHDSCILELPSSNAREIGLSSMELLLRPIIIKDESFVIPVDGLIGERWSESEMEKLK